MKKILITAAITASMGAMASTPAAAHPDNGILAPNECESVTDWKWRSVRNGMTLEQVEKVLGCHASHQQTNNTRKGDSDIWMFKHDGRHLAYVAIRNGKVWRKTMKFGSRRGE